MRLYKIVRKVASNLMPPGTVIERMRNNSLFIAIEDKITVNSNSFGLINSTYYPEYFRVVKEPTE